MSRMSDKWIALSEQAAEDTRQLRTRQDTEMVDLITRQTSEINALRAEITRLTEIMRQERSIEDAIVLARKAEQYHGEWKQTRGEAI